MIVVGVGVNIEVIMARSMVTSAIKTAARMGMGLTEGEPVEALGNCLIESVKGNIEDRDIFNEKIKESIDELREKVVKDGEKVIGASPYRYNVPALDVGMI